jgi:shikimate dehydrogenase
VAIKEAEGMPITQIFAEKGERYFRDKETAFLRRLRHHSIMAHGGRGAGKTLFTSAVVAMGGGAPLRKENRHIMRSAMFSFVIFIDRAPEAITAGVAYGAERPLLASPADVARLYQERLPLYRQTAHCVIKNDGAFDDTLDAILTVIQMRGGVDPFMPKTPRLIQIANEIPPASGVPPTPPYVVIGDPIAHSRSPTIHNAAFAFLKFEDQRQHIPKTYGMIRVRPAALESVMATFRNGSVRGLNITIPHKIAAARLVDAVCGDAKRAGAINTVVKVTDAALYTRLLGFNTDMEGLKLALARQGRAYKGSNVVIAGAGGAAAGIASKAAEEGAASIVILCRTLEKGEAIIRPLKRQLGKTSSVKLDVIPRDFSHADALTWTGKTTGMDMLMISFAEGALKNADIFINATPLGMAGVEADYADMSFLSLLKKDVFVADLVYNPPETKLLKAARAAGIACCNGLGMLIFQAILADELFMAADKYDNDHCQDDNYLDENGHSSDDIDTLLPSLETVEKELLNTRLSDEERNELFDYIKEKITNE